jgi:hypothetical protein
MSSADHIHLRNEVLALCTVSNDVNRTALNRCWRIAQAMQQVCQEKATRALADVGSRPLLWCYIADGWSARIRDESVHKVGDHWVKRSGHFKHEFLLERGLLRYIDANGAHRFHMLWGPPRGLRLGRTAWNVLTSATEFSESWRMQGHRGIILNVYIQDSVLFAAGLRLFAATTSLMYDADEVSDDPQFGPMERLREVSIGIRCKAHGCHNSIQWGLGPHYKLFIADECHIVIASLLNASSALVNRIDQFLLSKVRFVTRRESPEDVRAWWTAMEVRPEMLDLFVACNPWWDGEALLVDARMEHDAHAFGTLSSMLLYCLRWCQWSNSRWCRAGRSGRFLLRSLAVGTHCVAHMCLDDPECPNTKLNGYRRITPEIRKMCALMAFSARGAEALLVSLLEDDRLLLKVDEATNALADHITGIALLPDLVWQRLASLVGTGSGVEIKHETLYAASTTHGYVERDVFSTVRSGILGMTQGDLAHNVDMLVRGDLPATDPPMRQLKALLAAGELREHITDALLLLRSAPCTSTLVEEGHASAAVLKKFHSDVGEPYLQARSLLHSMRAMISSSKYLNKLGSIDREIAFQHARRPDKIGSRQALMQRCVSEALEGCADDPYARRKTSRACMRDLALAHDSLDLQDWAGRT